MFDKYGRPILKIDAGGTIPPPPPPPVRDESQEGTLGLPPLAGNVYDSSETGGRRPYRPGSTLFRPSPPTPQTPLLPKGGALTAGLGMQQASMDTGTAPFTSAGGQYKPTLNDIIAMFSNQGSGVGGMAAPDYSQYRAALTDQAQQINAQIQAMYNALGEEASANVGRIQDIYGGASTGIGDVYGSAIGNVGDAYSSAQQQAADQLARLGIEAAAPAVVNPMALSQAEAISQLEQGRAGGQAATERFGSAASGFGSQMAQVAQQQGTEMNAAVLNALQNRLNETLLMEEQGRQAASRGGGGGANPLESAMDYLRLQEMFNAPAMAQQELDFKAAQIAADNTLSERDKLIELALQFEKDRGLDPLQAQEEAAIYLDNANERFGLG